MPIPNSLFNPRVVKFSDFLTSDYLQFFEGYLNDLLDELDINVRDLAKQVVLRGGKRIRPVLVFLCGSSNSDATENLLKASSVIELVHVATLVHDDILDNASIRRGNPTLHSLHSKHTSILLGDALFSFALEIATTFPDTTVCRIVSKATRDTCTGEIDQNLFVNDFEMSLDKYYSIIQNKTGALFSASCSIGAYLSGASSIVMDLVCDF
jgi:octaprenyl-diphosphate synthase